MTEELLQNIKLKSKIHSKPKKNNRTNIKDLRNYYREAVFIMFGIVMTQSFYLMTNMIMSESKTFEGNDTEYLQWIFANIIIMSSWIGYMKTITHYRNKSNQYSTKSLLLDVLIIFEYYLLISASVVKDFSIPFNDFLYVMMIVIFATYFVWDIFQKITNQHKSVRPIILKFYPTSIALILTIVHYGAYLYIDLYDTIYLEFMFKIISSFNLNLEANLLGNIAISCMIVIGYRVHKYRRSRDHK